MLHFRSKVDPSLVVPILLGAAVTSSIVIGATIFGSAPPLLLVLRTAPAVMISTVAATWYELTDTDLRVDSAVDDPEHSPDTVPLSAPALSLDRLEVQHLSGRVIVSPHDQAGFVNALRARVPRLPIVAVAQPITSNV